MDYYFMPMETAPRDGTMVLLMGYPINVPVVGTFEENGWSTDHFDDCSDDVFCGWFPIPSLCKSNESN